MLAKRDGTSVQVVTETASTGVSRSPYTWVLHQSDTRRTLMMKTARSGHFVGQNLAAYSVDVYAWKANHAALQEHISGMRPAARDI